MFEAIFVRLVAGWLPESSLTARVYGAMIDIPLGLAGGVVGAALFQILSIHPHTGGRYLIVSTVGAASLLIGTLRAAQRVLNF